MAMSENTRKVIEEFHQKVGTNEFTYKEIQSLSISPRTFFQYANITEIERTKHHYYSTQEILDILNGCSGQDCYCDSWYYALDEQGRIYDTYTDITYKFNN